MLFRVVLPFLLLISILAANKRPLSNDETNQVDSKRQRLNDKTSILRDAVLEGDTEKISRILNESATKEEDLQEIYEICAAKGSSSTFKNLLNKFPAGWDKCCGWLSIATTNTNVRIVEYILGSGLCESTPILTNAFRVTLIGDRAGFSRDYRSNGRILSKGDDFGVHLALQNDDLDLLMVLLEIKTIPVPSPKLDAHKINQFIETYGSMITEFKNGSLDIQQQILSQNPPQQILSLLIGIARNSGNKDFLALAAKTLWSISQEEMLALMQVEGNSLVNLREFAKVCVVEVRDRLSGLFPAYLNGAIIIDTLSEIRDLTIAFAINDYLQ